MKRSPSARSRGGTHGSPATPLLLGRARHVGRGDGNPRNAWSTHERAPSPTPGATARTPRPPATRLFPRDVRARARSRASPRSPRPPSPGTSSSACCRSRARSSGPVAETHDLLHVGAALDRGRDRPPHPPLPRSASKTCRLERIRVVRSHPAALDQCRRLLAAMPWATAIAAGDDGRGGGRGRRARRSRGGRDRRRAGGRPLRPAACSPTTSATIPEAYTRFVSVATHTRLDRAAARNGGRRSRSSPTTGPARCTGRSSPSHGTGSTSSSSSPDRSPRLRGATASTPCSPATRSTRLIRARSAEVRAQARRLKLFGSYPAGGARADERPGRHPHPRADHEHRPRAARGDQPAARARPASCWRLQGAPRTCRSSTRPARNGCFAT